MFSLIYLVYEDNGHNLGCDMKGVKSCETFLVI